MTGCSTPSGNNSSGAGDIKLDYIQQPADSGLVEQAGHPAKPLAMWIDDSTLRLVWQDSPGCPEHPIAFSHDGAGAYYLKFDFEPPRTINDPCDASARLMATTFRGVPRPAASEYTLAFTLAISPSAHTSVTIS